MASIKTVVAKTAAVQTAVQRGQGRRHLDGPKTADVKMASVKIAVVKTAVTHGQGGQGQGGRC